MAVQVRRRRDTGTEVQDRDAGEREWLLRVGDERTRPVQRQGKIMGQRWRGAGQWESTTGKVQERSKRRRTFQCIVLYRQFSSAQLPIWAHPVCGIPSVVGIQPARVQVLDDLQPLC